MLKTAPQAANDQVGETAQLADFLAATRFADLPTEAIDAAKIFVLDLIGCALGAQRTDEVRIAAEVTRQLGGTPDCSVLGLDFKTSCQNAAYLNGISSHVIELDDTHRSSITHV